MAKRATAKKKTAAKRPASKGKTKAAPKAKAPKAKAKAKAVKAAAPKQALSTRKMEALLAQVVERLDNVSDGLSAIQHEVSRNQGESAGVYGREDSAEAMQQPS